MVRVTVQRPVRLTVWLRVRFHFTTTKTTLPSKRFHPSNLRSPRDVQQKAKKGEPKEFKETPKEWTVEEEIALCQGWCDVSKNSISGNSMKAKGFWEAVIRYFENETGLTRGHDSIVSK
nr:hypothetical protein [Tanacetum cinerariifolium]